MIARVIVANVMRAIVTEKVVVMSTLAVVIANLETVTVMVIEIANTLVATEVVKITVVLGLVQDTRTG